MSTANPFTRARLAREAAARAKLAEYLRLVADCLGHPVEDYTTIDALRSINTAESMAITLIEEAGAS